MPQCSTRVQRRRSQSCRCPCPCRGPAGRLGSYQILCLCLVRRGARRRERHEPTGRREGTHERVGRFRPQRTRPDAEPFTAVATDDFSLAGWRIPEPADDGAVDPTKGEYLSDRCQRHATGRAHLTRERGTRRGTEFLF
ncbi:hypothetical protein BDZ90DRAFT_2579 [Jaminaea rosea]|uniref:Uncharacterized protein n=1 Tax=Jaminaea rosea TaxID=1569628 RepID=A0A316UYX7_9BASI|nr:hypothetical protein BDZ90DRAFT_2579 [Jaminaea rosea]PWN29998.1 hypothetical protein BDZ90DRAFT_2579 [Jaminaea rosea]